MKYTWTEALCHGWGCVGVWPKHLVDAAERDADGRPILDESDMIVGNGVGWDSPGTFDDDWMQRACDALNAIERKGSGKKWLTQRQGGVECHS